MIFNTNTAFNIQKKDVKFLDAGIHEDVSLEKVRHDRSPNGNMFIEFTFAKDGTFMTHTEYEPTKFQDQTDAEFEKKSKYTSSKNPSDNGGVLQRSTQLYC